MARESGAARRTRRAMARSGASFARAGVSGRQGSTWGFSAATGFVDDLAQQLEDEINQFQQQLGVYAQTGAPPELSSELTLAEPLSRYEAFDNVMQREGGSLRAPGAYGGYGPNQDPSLSGGEWFTKFGNEIGIWLEKPYAELAVGEEFLIPMNPRGSKWNEVQSGGLRGRKDSSGWIVFDEAYRIGERIGMRQTAVSPNQYNTAFAMGRQSPQTTELRQETATARFQAEQTQRRSETLERRTSDLRGRFKQRQAEHEKALDSYQRQRQRFEREQQARRQAVAGQRGLAFASTEEPYRTDTLGTAP